MKDVKLKVVKTESELIAEFETCVNMSVKDLTDNLSFGDPEFDPTSAR